MPPDLRARIEREAEIAGRSLNAEIVARLWKSVEPARPGADVAPVLREGCGSYAALSENEQAMLALFRRWSAEKQLGFLVLFK